MWACVNLLAGCECIIFHNQPAVWCTRENEAAVALQMERRLAGENVFAGCFFFFVCGEWWETETEGRRGKDKKEKGGQRLVWLDLCVTVRNWSLILGIIAVITHHHFWISECVCILLRWLSLWCERGMERWEVIKEVLIFYHQHLVSDEHFVASSNRYWHSYNS